MLHHFCPLESHVQSKMQISDSEARTDYRLVYAQGTKIPMILATAFAL
tara:strand:+ start:132 stop:275 length:144 start_codon:yes stop_codon:yes gene_type:complete